MTDNFLPIQLEGIISDSVPILNDNFQTLLSTSSGEQFPTTNLYLGRLFYRPSEATLYVLTKEAPDEIWSKLSATKGPNGSDGEILIINNVISLPNPYSYEINKLALVKEDNLYLDTLIGSYAEGTISAVSGTNIITGTGTYWATDGNVVAGDELTINVSGTAQTAVVQTVNNDTSLEVSEVLTFAIPASSNYSVLRRRWVAVLQVPKKILYGAVLPIDTTQYKVGDYFILETTYDNNKKGIYTYIGEDQPKFINILSVDDISSGLLNAGIVKGYGSEFPDPYTYNHGDLFLLSEDVGENSKGFYRIIFPAFTAGASSEEADGTITINAVVFEDNLFYPALANHVVTLNKLTDKWRITITFSEGDVVTPALYFAIRADSGNVFEVLSDTAQLSESSIYADIVENDFAEFNLFVTQNPLVAGASIYISADEPKKFAPLGIIPSLVPSELRDKLISGIPDRASDTVLVIGDDGKLGKETKRLGVLKGFGNVLPDVSTYDVSDLFLLNADIGTNKKGFYRLVSEEGVSVFARMNVIPVDGGGGDNPPELTPDQVRAKVVDGIVNTSGTKILVINEEGSLGEAEFSDIVTPDKLREEVVRDISSVDGDRVLTISSENVLGYSASGDVYNQGIVKGSGTVLPDVEDLLYDGDTLFLLKEDFSGNKKGFYFRTDFNFIYKPTLNLVDPAIISGSQLFAKFNEEDGGGLVIADNLYGATENEIYIPGEAVSDNTTKDNIYIVWTSGARPSDSILRQPVTFKLNRESGESVEFRINQAHYYHASVGGVDHSFLYFLIPPEKIDEYNVVTSASGKIGAYMYHDYPLVWNRVNVIPTDLTSEELRSKFITDIPTTDPSKILVVGSDGSVGEAESDVLDTSLIVLDSFPDAHSWTGTSVIFVNGDGLYKIVHEDNEQGLGRIKSEHGNFQHIIGEGTNFTSSLLGAKLRVNLTSDERRIYPYLPATAIFTVSSIVSPTELIGEFDRDSKRYSFLIGSYRPYWETNIFWERISYVPTEAQIKAGFIENLNILSNPTGLVAIGNDGNIGYTENEFKRTPDELREAIVEGLPETETPDKIVALDDAGVLASSGVPNRRTPEELREVIVEGLPETDDPNKMISLDSTGALSASFVPGNSLKDGRLIKAVAKTFPDDVSDYNYKDLFLLSENSGAFARGLYQYLGGKFKPFDSSIREGANDELYEIDINAFTSNQLSPYYVRAAGGTSLDEAVFAFRTNNNVRIVGSSEVFVFILNSEEELFSAFGEIHNDGTAFLVTFSDEDLIAYTKYIAKVYNNPEIKLSVFIGDRINNFTDELSIPHGFGIIDHGAELPTNLDDYDQRTYFLRSSEIYSNNAIYGLNNFTTFSNPITNSTIPTVYFGGTIKETRLLNISYRSRYVELGLAAYRPDGTGLYTTNNRINIILSSNNHHNSYVLTDIKYVGATHYYGIYSYRYRIPFTSSADAFWSALLSDSKLTIHELDATKVLNKIAPLYPQIISANLPADASIARDKTGFSSPSILITSGKLGLVTFEFGNPLLFSQISNLIIDLQFKTSIDGFPKVWQPIPVHIDPAFLATLTRAGSFDFIDQRGALDSTIEQSVFVGMTTSTPHIKPIVFGENAINYHSSVIGLNMTFWNDTQYRPSSLAGIVLYSLRSSAIGLGGGSDETQVRILDVTTQRK